MENRVEMMGYAAFAVSGLCITVAVLSLGLTPETTSVATTMTLGAFGVSLVGLGLSCVWDGQRAVHAVAPRLSHDDVSPRPRDAA
jgi:hypothetical protein